MTADFTRILAPNPSPLTLTGTNTWVVGRDPAWVVDPGPAIESHLDAVAAEVAARGGAGGIALTHDHADHSEAIEPLRARLGGVPVGSRHWRRRRARRRSTCTSIPGHADDHLVFVAGGAAFTGDAVLGQGSVFVSGRLREYLDGPAAAARAGAGRDLPRARRPGDRPGGASSTSTSPTAPSASASCWRRWRRARGREDELLDAAWADAPANVRQFAAISMRAHLEKLREEGLAPG